MKDSELTIAVCGPVDAGKSSLIGVLTSGQLDDGRGLARNKVLIHPHERESGRTSHITYNPLIYKFENDKIKLQNPRIKSDNLFDFYPENIEPIFNNKIVSFLDLAGHERYLKTTIFGVTGLFPDYGIVVIGANTGITKLTREHIGILLYLNIPFIITITKIDMSPKEVYQSLCVQIKRLLGRNTFNKILYFIPNSEQSNKETELYINSMSDNKDIIPIISISNKTGTNIENLHKILYSLKPRNKWFSNDSCNTTFYIDSVFMVQGIGLVVSGVTKGIPIKVKQKLFIGPFNKDGSFKEIQVRSIHNSIKELVNETIPGSQSCLAIKLTNNKDVLDRKMIRKGMVVIDNINKIKSQVCYDFIAKINILHHSTSIRTGYSPVIHCGPIRQSAIIDLSDDKETDCLRSGDNRIVKFKFSYRPEFIEENMVFFFRDGSTKGVGQVIKLNN